MHRISVLALSLLLVGVHRSQMSTVFDLDRVGHVVPDITLTTVDGAPLALTAPFGRPALIFLFASWCAPCTLELPWVKAAYARYGDRVAFIGVDVLETDASAATFVRGQAFSFDVGIVDKATIDNVADDDAREAGGAKYRIPAVYAIDAGGVVRGAWHGLPVTTDGTPIDPLPQYLERLGIAAGTDPTL